MRKSFVLFLVFPLILILLNTACSRDRQESAAPATTGFHTITPAAAMGLIQTRKNLFILDVRSPQELRQGAIANYHLVPIWQLGKSFHPDPDQPILVYCAVGGRSYMAGQFLYRNGVREVYNIQGGIAAWKKAGLPLVYPST